MTEIKLRIDFDKERYIGHGRIQLLELIGEHGSIAQAAKAMDMSYKRAWDLVEELNGIFDKPLVSSQSGGKKGGGASLTELGQEIVAQYNQVVMSAETAAKALLKRIEQQTRR